MPDDALTALRAQLGDTAPDSLRTLSDTELRDLSAALADARQRQAAALERLPVLDQNLSGYSV